MGTLLLFTSLFFSFHKINNMDLKKLKQDHPTLMEIKKNLPKHVFESDLKKSLYYVFKDLSIISLLGISYYYVNQMNLPVIVHQLASTLYFISQGVMFWALFVLAHDCGHGSFSKYTGINDFIGTILNCIILVPYAPWKYSHRHHHKNTGNIDKDEIFYPIRSKNKRPGGIATNYYFGLGLGWFAYILIGFSPRKVSHINPNEELYSRVRPAVMTSIIAWFTSVGLVSLAVLRFSLTSVVQYYLLPLFVFATLLVVTTFLHHHDENVPWYGDSEWNYVLGNLSSVDRNYGIIHNITHNIGTHQIHHLFPIIPHYNLEEATSAFRKTYPHLVRLSNESIFLSFVKMAKLYSEQCMISDDCNYHVYQNKLNKKD